MSKPERRIRCGPITATIWMETKVINSEMVKFYSATIDKAYKEGEEWKHTHSFAVENLPKVAIVAEEAYKHLRLSATVPNEDSE